MNPTDANPQPLVLEYLLDAPAEKVWRAIGIPALRGTMVTEYYIGRC